MISDCTDLRCNCFGLAVVTTVQTGPPLPMKVRQDSILVAKRKTVHADHTRQISKGNRFQPGATSTVARAPLQELGNKNSQLVDRWSARKSVACGRQLKSSADPTQVRKPNRSCSSKLDNSHKLSAPDSQNSIIDLDHDSMGLFLRVVQRCCRNASDIPLRQTLELLSSRTTRKGGGAHDFGRNRALRELLDRVPMGSLSRSSAQGGQCLRMPGMPANSWVLTEKVGDGKYGETFRAYAQGTGNKSAICKINLQAGDGEESGAEEQLGPEEQKLEAMVQMLVNEVDPLAAPTVFGMVNLHSTAGLRGQRCGELCLVMQPLDDTLGDRLQLAEAAQARGAAHMALRDVATAFCNLQVEPGQRP